MYYSSCECMNIPILSLNTCPGPQLTTRSQWVHPLSSVAEDDWEKQQLQLACQQSLEESQQAKEALERCQNAVAERLRELGMQRLDTIADGNCLYVALAFSCGLPIQPEHLRREICAYILHMKDFFCLGWTPADLKTSKHTSPTWRRTVLTGMNSLYRVLPICL